MKTLTEDLKVKTFLDDDFLLETKAASVLYHEYARHMPIVDFHNHLPPSDIVANRCFKNITEVWIEGDHYKWRAMRANGVSEKFCTGDAPPFEKFRKWAETVPYTIRNPLFHWTQLELKNYFAVTKLLTPDSAAEIYEQCSSLLEGDDFRVRALLEKMNVETVCTTDDPTDSLEHHKQFSSSPQAFSMYPTFRPDKVTQTDDPVKYNAYIDKLSSGSGMEINSFEDLCLALQKRIDLFDELGCRASDHGYETMYFDSNYQSLSSRLFKKVRNGQALEPAEKNSLACAIQVALSRMYKSKGWVQQFHLGAMRNNNLKRLKELGPDTGFDSIGDFPQVRTVGKFLAHLDESGELTKTILYNLNPSDFEMFVTMGGNFNDEAVAAKVQCGAAWWFLDQKEGIEKQLNAVSYFGLLARFVGMVTDSRSFLSFPRHEYFRRILCNLIGNDISRGELPNDLPWLGKIIQDICYHNAKNYFRFDKK